MEEVVALIVGGRLHRCGVTLSHEARLCCMYTTPQLHCDAFRLGSVKTRTF